MYIHRYVKLSNHKTIKKTRKNKRRNTFCAGYKHNYLTIKSILRWQNKVQVKPVDFLALVTPRLPHAPLLHILRK